jgi:hypothetical protein
MRTFQLILDSRTRTSNNVYNATFQLTKPISRVQKVRVKHVQFANTLYNVADGENTLVLSTGTLVIPPGFYSPVELVALLQTICAVTYNLGKLTWTLGTGVSIVTATTTMREILGLTLNNTYTNTFTTQLYLASPMNMDFISSQITDSQNYVVYSGRERTMNNQPFFITPVTEGFGKMCIYSPYNMHDIQIGNGSLSQLDFLMCDSNSGRVLTELSHWSMLLEVDCY